METHHDVLYSSIKDGEEREDFALTMEKAEVPQYIELRFTDTPE